MPLYAELHRHLGGAVVPRIFWRFLHRHNHPLAAHYPDYESFERFVTRPRATLTEFLELHTMVEQVQTLENLPYFISKLVRGAYVFEGILYMELRYTPFYRTDPTLSEAERLLQMREVVRTVHQAAESSEYPLILRQILCMHSRLPYAINRAIVDLAASESECVCGVDLAGPDTLCGTPARVDGPLRLRTFFRPENHLPPFRDAQRALSGVVAVCRPHRARHSDSVAATGTFGSHRRTRAVFRGLSNVLSAHRHHAIAGGAARGVRALWECRGRCRYLYRQSRSA